MSECIAWWGGMRKDGYGYVGRGESAHRHVWTECFGEIPPLAVIHHECRNTACVNPEHLQLVKDAATHSAMHERKRAHCHYCGRESRRVIPWLGIKLWVCRGCDDLLRCDPYYERG